jgi:hypothetical protein
MIAQKVYKFLYRNLSVVNGKEEYNILKECYEIYGRYDYRGKVVLDIGADFGLSPKFFIDHGAKKVIAYSPMRQKHQIRDEKIEWNREYWQGEERSADFLKIDCEGCEYQRPVDFYFLWYPEALIAIHDLGDERFREYFEALSKKGALVYNNGDEYLFYWRRRGLLDE